MGGKWVQLIMVGIAHQGMRLPLVGQTLNGQGNTPKVVGQALLTCLDKWIDHRQQQLWWVADREYIGKEGLKELTSRHMQFCIRLPKNAMVRQANKAIKTHQLFQTNT